MRRSLILTALGLVGIVGSADASSSWRWHRHARGPAPQLLAASSARPYIPPPYSIADVIRRSQYAAGAYWGEAPPCGMPTVTLVATLPRNYLGMAASETCGIELLTNVVDQTDALGYLESCELMTHEWGHLILGVNYFASTNPADPAHSRDPTSIMNGDDVPWLTTPQCLATQPRSIRGHLLRLWRSQDWCYESAVGDSSPGWNRGRCVLATKPPGA